MKLECKDIVIKNKTILKNSSVDLPDVGNTIRDYYSWQDLIDGGYVSVVDNKLEWFRLPFWNRLHSQMSEFMIILPKNINYIESGCFTGNFCSNHNGRCINYILIPNENNVEFGEGCFKKN